MLQPTFLEPRKLGQISILVHELESVKIFEVNDERVNFVTFDILFY